MTGSADFAAKQRQQAAHAIGQVRHAHPDGQQGMRHQRGLGWDQAWKDVVGKIDARAGNHRKQGRQQPLAPAELVHKAHHGPERDQIPAERGSEPSKQLMEQQQRDDRGSGDHMHPDEFPGENDLLEAGIAAVALNIEHWSSLKSGGGEEVVLDQDGGTIRKTEPRFSLSNLTAAVHAKIASHEEVFDFALGPHGLGGETGKGVSVDAQAIHSVFDLNACSFIGAHRRFGLGGTFVLACADVGVAEGVSRDRVALRRRGHAHGKAMSDGEGVRAQRAAAGITQVDAAFQVVGDHVGAQRDAVAIAVEDQSGAVALLDHVAADHRAVGVFDDDAVAEVVIDIVAVHAQVEGIRAVQRVLVFLEVVRVHHDVVAVENLDPAFLVVSQDAVRDAWVLKTALQVDAVAAVVVDGHAFEVNLLDALGEDAVAALFGSTDPQVGHLDTPEPGFFVLVEVGRAEDEGRRTLLVLVLDVCGRPGAHDAGVAGFHSQGLGDLVEARRKGHQSAGLGNGVQGGLKVREFRGIDRCGG